jgi:hypothetical protein
MSSSLVAWFETRPNVAPTIPPPARGDNVLAVAIADDGTAEVRILQLSDGSFTFVIEAWTNFCDAGGNPHYLWWEFHPPIAGRFDSLAVVKEEAIVDARTRKLTLHPFETVRH